MNEVRTTTETTLVIIDTSQNAIAELHSTDDPFEAIDYNFGKCRGDVFQLANQVVEGKVEKSRISGSDNQYSWVFRPDYANAKLEILRTWKWTGRQFKEV